MTAPRKKTYAYQSIPDVGQGGPSFHLAPYLPGYSSPQYPDTATGDPAQYAYQSIPDVGPAGAATNRAQPQAAYDPGVAAYDPNSSMGSVFNQGFIPVTNPVIPPYVPPPPVVQAAATQPTAQMLPANISGGPYSGGGPVAAGLTPPQVMLGVS
jgi:hypothetical protein